MINEATVNTPVANGGTAVHPTLSMLGITKHYDAIAALTDVSFDVLPGEVHALLGENGAGKSTLMNVASGTTTPDGGTIVFDGSRVDNLTPALAQDLGIAIVHQHPALLPDMTVAENIRVAVGTRASAASRSRRDESDALAARRRPLPGPSRGPRLVPQRRPPPPARARQGVRRVAAAADPRRADGAALAGFRRAPLHGRPQARGETGRPSSTSRTGWARFARSPIVSPSCATARFGGRPRSRTSPTPTSSP